MSDVEANRKQASAPAPRKRTLPSWGGSTKPKTNGAKEKRCIIDWRGLYEDAKTRHALVVYVRIAFIADLATDAGMAAALALAGLSGPAAAVALVMCINHMLAGVMILRAHRSMHPRPWTYKQYALVVAQALFIAPLAVVALDASAINLALTWHRAFANESKRERVNRIAAYGTARGTLEAVVEAPLMLVVELALLGALGSGRLSGGMAVTAAVSLAFICTLATLVAHAVRLRRFKNGVELSSRDYFPALLEMRPPLPLHAIERNRLTKVKIGLRPSRREARVLTKLLSLNTSLTHIDVSGIGLVDSDVARITELCKRSEILEFLNLLTNAFSPEAANGIVAACSLTSPPRVRTVCGFVPTESHFDLSGSGLGDVDAILLAYEVKANKSVRVLNLLENNMVDAHYFAKLVTACENADDLVAAMERKALAPARHHKHSSETDSARGRPPEGNGYPLDDDEYGEDAHGGMTGSTTAPHEEEVARALVFLGTTMRVTASNAIHIAHRGTFISNAKAIGPILDSMADHSARARAQAWGCEALARICEVDAAMGGTVREEAAASGALKSIVSALNTHPNELDVQRDGCRALAALCSGAGADGRARADMAVGAGALKAVMVALQTHAQTHQVIGEMGARAAANIVEGQEEGDAGGPTRRQAMTDAQGPDALLEAMAAFPLAPKLQAEALRALAATACDRDEAGRLRAQDTLEAGAVAAAVSSLGAHPWNHRVLKAGCALFANLAEGENAAAVARQAHVVDEGGARACVTALDAFRTKNHAELAAEAVRALRNLTFADKQAAAAVDEAALPVLVAALTTHALNAKLCRDGVRAIAHCARGAMPADASTRAGHAADAGALGAIAGAMRAHPDDVEVQAWGCAAVCHVTAGDDGGAFRRQTQAVNEDALGATIVAMEGAGRSAASQEWGSMCVRNIASGPAPNSRHLASAAVDSGAAHALIAAMQANPSSPTLQLAAAEAIAHLARGDAGEAMAPGEPTGDDEGAPARRNALAAVKAPELLVACMISYADNRALQTWACAAVRHMTAGADAGAPERREAAAGAGAAKTLCDAALAHPTSAVLQQEVCAAVANIACGVDRASLARKAAFAEAGAHNACAKAARAHPKACEAQGTLALATLADGPEVGGGDSAARATAAATAILRAVEASPAEEKADWACVVAQRMQNHALIPAGSTPAPSEGAIRTLLAIMLEFADSAAVSETVASCIEAVVGGAAGHGEGARARADQAVAAGAFESIVRAMDAHKRLEGVQRAGSAAAAALCAGEDGAATLARRERALAAGAARPIATAMTAHPAAVERAGTAFLCYFASGDDELLPSNQYKRAHAAVFGLVAAGASAAPTEVQVAWGEQLARSASRMMSEGAIGIGADGGGEMGPPAPDGALRVLVAIVNGYMKHTAAAIAGCAALATSVLEAHSGGPAALALMAADAHALPAAVSAMEIHPTSTAVLSAAARAIAAIAGSDVSGTVRPRAVEAGALRALCAALADHWPEATVTNEAVSAIVAIVGSEGAADPHGPPPPHAAPTAAALTGALRRTTQLEDVQEHGCRALFTVAKAAAGVGGEAVVSAGGMAAVVAAARAHPASVEVQRWALAAAAECARAPDTGGRARATAAVEAGVHACALDALLAHANAVLVCRSALDALGTIASGDDGAAESRRAAVGGSREGPNALVLALRAQPTDVQTQQLGAWLLGSLADGAPSEAADARAHALVAIGALAELLKAYSVNVSDSALSELVCRAICMLTAPSPGADERAAGAVLAGAVPVIVQIMPAHAEQNLALACWATAALRNLVNASDAGGQARRKTAVDCGAPRALCGAMAAHKRDTFVQAVGASALKSISSGMDKGGVWRKEAVADAGAVDALVSVLKEVGEESPEAAEQAARALANVTAGSDKLGLARKARAYNAHATPALVHVMTVHNALPAVQEAACGALRNIAYGTGDKENVARKNEAVESGALAAAVLAMNTHSAHSGVQQMGCGAITSIGFGFDITNKSAPAFAQVAIDAGALAATLGAMSRFATDEAVQEQGVKALRNLSYGGSDKKTERVQQTMAERGALEAIVAALTSFPANAEIVQDGLWAIGNICDKGGAAKKRANSAGARAAVAAAKRSYPDIGPIAEAAENAFRLL